MNHTAHKSECKYCCHRKKSRKYFAESAAEGFLYVINGAAVYGTVTVCFSCFYGEGSFGIYCRHAEKRYYPHPKYCARTADKNGSAGSDDVSCSDLSCYCGCKRLKRRKSAFLFSAFEAYVSENFFHSFAKTAHLNKSGFYREKQSHADEKDYQNIIRKIRIDF